jgi:excisionase family DNA binding protein
MVNDTSTLARPLTLTEAAEYLQIPPRAVRELCTAKKIDHARLDHRNWRFTRADLDLYIAKRTVVAG